MTIIVGILCSDGCILASDGMASNNLGTIPFVGIQNTKIHKISDEAVVSCAGDDNLMTLFLNFLEKNYLRLKNQGNYTCPIELATAIGSQFSHQVISSYGQYPPLFQEHYINKMKQNSGLEFGAVIAFEFNGEHCMFGYDGFLNPSKIRTNGIWYSIIGSGALVAKPSIHLVKKILKIENQPDVNQGSILAYWTISHAIDVSSGGIGGNISLFSLSKEKGNERYKISEINTSENKTAIEAIYTHIWNYQKADDSETKEIPKI